MDFVEDLSKISRRHAEETCSHSDEKSDAKSDERLCSINRKLLKKKVMRIKLKVQQAKESSKGEMVTGGGGAHVCKACGKSFSSGKALGGHMRVHSSEGEDNANSNKKTTKHEKAGVVSSSEKKTSSANGEQICSECGKHFPSHKSLYGHMRCHPDRKWRGIVPPAKNSSDSTVYSGSNLKNTDDQMDSSSSEKSVAPQTGSLANWPVRARRGRKNPVAASPDDGEAATNLLLLAFGSSSKMKREPDESADNKEEISSAKDTDSSDEYETGEKDMGPVPENENRDEVCEESESNYSRQLVGMTEINYKKMKRKRKFRALETVASGRYKCSTCNKSFDSHQALGGHRASHKKHKNEEDQGDKEDNPSASRSEGPNEPTEAHICQICHKSFPSGQALGGHKRCHYTFPSEAAASSASSPEVQKAGPRVMDFDLNQLPPMEEDDDVAGVELPAPRHLLGH